jgi:ssDNA-binding Zn-finger/Zn-ribbon topoisomerase 1
MFEYSEWKDEDERKCPQCDKFTLRYRYVEDHQGHEDVEYVCGNCGFHDYIDGSDY